MFNAGCGRIRDGLTELGLDADELLRHGAPRLVYGVALVRNLWGYLLGMEKTPRYVLPREVGRGAGRGGGGGERKAVLGRTINWWLRRWARGRVMRGDVLERVGRHNFVHRIRHGGRVVLPPDREQPLLFE